MRGIKEGWFPKIAPPELPSEDLYGTCDEIINRTTESYDVVHFYPWGDPAYWRGSLVNETDTIGPEPLDMSNHHRFRIRRHLTDFGTQVGLFIFAALLIIGWRRHHQDCQRKAGYQEILV